MNDLTTAFIRPIQALGLNASKSNVSFASNDGCGESIVVTTKDHTIICFLSVNGQIATIDQLGHDGFHVPIAIDLASPTSVQEILEIVKHNAKVNEALNVSMGCSRLED